MTDTITISRELAERLALKRAADGWLALNTAEAFEAGKELRSLLDVQPSEPHGVDKEYHDRAIAEKDAEIARLEQECSALAASACDGVVGDDYGNAHCRYRAERDQLRAELDNMRISWGLMQAENERLRAQVSTDNSDTLRNALAELERAEAERDELRGDAERYRWLRDTAPSTCGEVPMVSLADDGGDQTSNWLYGNGLDGIMDAAMAAKEAE